MKPVNLDYLRGLTKGPDRIEDFQILHGSPVDEDEYVVNEREVAQVAPYLEAAIGFFGHTHLQGGFLCHRNGVKRLRVVEEDAKSQTYDLDSEAVYLINVGSVGQPRDGDPRAAYAIYEPANRLVTLYRVEYNIAAAQRKIVKAGLPEMLALRLEAGV